MVCRETRLAIDGALVGPYNRRVLARHTQSRSGEKMRKLAALFLLGIGASVLACALPPVPEIDPGTGASALALLGGALLVYRGRRK